MTYPESKDIPQTRLVQVKFIHIANCYILLIGVTQIMAFLRKIYSFVCSGSHDVHDVFFIAFRAGSTLIQYSTDY